MNPATKLPILLLFILIPLSASGFAKYGAADELRKTEIELFQLPKGTAEEAAAHVEKVAKENGVELEIFINTDTTNWEIFDNGLTLKNFDLYAILQSLFKHGGNEILAKEATEGHPIHIYIYKRASINEITITSTMYFWRDDAPPSSLFTLKDFNSKERVPKSVTLFYNWVGDFMQVQQMLNEIAANRIKINHDFIDEKKYGFLCKMNTTQGNLYFGMTNNQTAFLNVELTPEAKQSLPIFTNELVGLLPSEYKSRGCSS